MVISALVVIPAADGDLLAARLAAEPDLEVGPLQREPPALPVVLEAADPAASRRRLDQLLARPDVARVEVVRIDFPTSVGPTGESSP